MSSLSRATGRHTTHLEERAADGVVVVGRHVSSTARHRLPIHPPRRGCLLIAIPAVRPLTQRAVLTGVARPAHVRSRFSSSLIVAAAAARDILITLLITVVALCCLIPRVYVKCSVACLTAILWRSRLLPSSVGRCTTRPLRPDFSLEFTHLQAAVQQHAQPWMMAAVQTLAAADTCTSVIPPQRAGARTA
jgi:hypothetical protein